MLDGAGGMALQGIQPRLKDIVYRMAATSEAIPFKCGVTILCNTTPTVGDDYGNVQIQVENLALVQCKISNDCEQRTSKKLILVLKECKNLVYDLNIARNRKKLHALPLSILTSYIG